MSKETWERVCAECGKLSRYHCTEYADFCKGCGAPVPKWKSTRTNYRHLYISDTADKADITKENLE